MLPLTQRATRHPLLPGPARKSLVPPTASFVGALGALLLWPISAPANIHTVENLTSTSHDYKTTVTYQKGNGSVTLTFTVPANSSVTIGGKTGIGSSKNQEIVGTIPTVDQVADLGPSNGASVTIVANEPQADTGQAAQVLVDALTDGPVYSFFDFAFTNYQQLNANVPFVFGGLNGSGQPILDLASNPLVQITDANGNLLPQFAFTDPTLALTDIFVSGVPAPSTWATLIFGVACVIGTRLRRRASQRAD
jgi:hypothetical protein